VTSRTPASGIGRPEERGESKRKGRREGWIIGTVGSWSDNCGSGNGEGSLGKLGAAEF